MRFRSVIVCLALLLLSGSLPAKPAKVKLKTLSASGVTLRYPSTWHLTADQATLKRLTQEGTKLAGGKLPESPVGLQFTLYEKKPGTTGRRHNPGLSLSVEALPGPLSSKEYAEIGYNNMKRMMPGAKFTGSPPARARKLGPHTFYVLRYELSMNGNSTSAGIYAITNTKTLTAYCFSVYPDPIGLAPFEAVLASVTLPGGFVGAP